MMKLYMTPIKNRSFQAVALKVTWKFTDNSGIFKIAIDCSWSEFIRKMKSGNLHLQTRFVTSTS